MASNVPETKLTLEQLKKLGAVAEKVKANLIGPNGPFTVEKQQVLGRPNLCYVKGPHTLIDFYESQFPKFKDVTFLVYGEERLSFGEVQQLSYALGYQLSQHGVKTGDRVALATKNLPEWCIAFFAVTYIGAVIVPLNSWWVSEELEYGLTDSGSKFVICDPERLARLVKPLQKLKLPAILVREDKKKEIKEKLNFPLYHWNEFVKGGQGKKVVGKVHPDDNAAIMYTSGTTGHPKGVVLTHRGITYQMITSEAGAVLQDKVAELVGMPIPNDPPGAILPVPLFHVTACHHLFLASLVGGRKLVIMSRWDAGEALKLIHKERPTAWTGVPTMVSDLMEHKDFDKYDTSSLRFVAGGGAPTPKSQVLKVDKKFKNGRPGQGYGLTETNGGIAQNGGDMYILKPLSTGVPHPIVEVKVVDLETNKDLPVGERGELLIRSSLNMKEYWGKPEATKKVMTDDGWFRSGDVAMIDPEGYIYIVDRAKDIIIRGGENISCADVEHAIHSFPAVREAAVFGIPDERLGERVGTLIMLKDGQKATPTEIVTHLKSHLAGFKIPLPNDIFFTHEQLPRGATGKIQKRDIKEKVLASIKPVSKL